MQVKVKVKSITINGEAHARGALIDLPDDVAAAHARAGHVEVTEAPKPKRTAKPKVAASEEG